MPATIINGKETSSRMRLEIKERVAALEEKEGVTPGLAVILVGDNPASQSYVSAKKKACAELGIRSDSVHLPSDTSEAELLDIIERKNQDPSIHGILVQLPLPRHINEDHVINAISPAKDVDGFHPLNLGNMLLGRPCFISCTPHGILHLLKLNGISTDGANVVIVGRSNIVGKPLANLLLQKNGLGNATVTVCHTGTRDLAAHTRRADILIAAAGRPHTITADMVNPGAVVIDVGVNRVPDATLERGYRLTGDVDFAEVSDVASAITPVPGGVGPMTITMLMYNTVLSAERMAGLA